MTVLDGYGLSETSLLASLNPPDWPVKPGSIGTPIPGVEMRLVDDAGREVSDPGRAGEIQIRAGNVVKGRRRWLLLHCRPKERRDHPGRL